MQRGHIAATVFGWALCSSVHAAVAIFSFGSGTASTNWVDNLSFHATDTAGVLHSLQVRAYSDDKVGVPGSSSETFEAGKIRQYTAGLAACGAIELPNCFFPSRPVDNENREEWLFLTFDRPIAFNSIDLTPFESRDYDVSYWVGTIPEGQLDQNGLTGKTFDFIYANASNKAGVDVYSQAMDGGPAFALEGSGNFLLVGANRAYR